MTVRDLADLLKCSPRQVYRLVKDGLPAVRLGAKSLRFRQTEVEGWLEGRSAWNRYAEREEHIGLTKGAMI
jgi:excisionase family DNA binding protein